jgi:hypothetical protein
MVFHLAQAVTVRLSEARPVTGGLLFQIAIPGAGARPGDSGARRGSRPTRARSP